MQQRDGRKVEDVNSFVIFFFYFIFRGISGIFMVDRCATKRIGTNLT